jgi:RHS repeat-associated protein
MGGATSNGNAFPFIVGTIDYVPSGQILRCFYGNGVVTEYEYDRRSRMSSLVTARAEEPTNPLLAYDYTFDGVNNITRIDDRRPGTDRPAGDRRRNTQIFSYDTLYRLTNVQYSFALPGGPDRDDGRIAYRYDSIGNMLSKTSDIEHRENGLSVTNLGNMNYGGDLGKSNRVGRAEGDPPGPHALTVAETSTENRLYPYDANGNMTNIDGLECIWDYRDRLVAVENDKMRAEYIYDYGDRRIIKKAWNKTDTAPGDSPSLTTLYIDRYFEVRDNDQPVKYVWRGAVRQAKIIGTLDPTAKRVQRLRICEGWNLLSLAVDAIDSASQILSHPEVESLLRWDRSAKSYVRVNSVDPLPSGSVFWIRSSTSTTVEVMGIYRDPSGSPFESGGDFAASGALESLNVEESLPEDFTEAWAYDQESKAWQGQFTGGLEFLSDLPQHIPSGQPIYIRTADATPEIKTISREKRIQYYHQDHLASSNITTDGEGNFVEEVVFYPFGHPRHRHQLSEIGNVPESYLFAQKELDVLTGLQYFEARYLAGPLGRFLSVDPVQPGSSQSRSPYAYAAGNPLRFVDPLGTNLFDIFPTPIEKAYQAQLYARRAGLSEAEQQKAYEEQYQVYAELGAYTGKVTVEVAATLATAGGSQGAKAAVTKGPSVAGSIATKGKTAIATVKSWGSRGWRHAKRLFRRGGSGAKGAGTSTGARTARISEEMIEWRKALSEAMMEGAERIMKSKEVIGGKGGMEWVPFGRMQGGTPYLPTRFVGEVEPLLKMVKGGFVEAGKTTGDVASFFVETGGKLLDVMPAVVPW